MTNALKKSIQGALGRAGFKLVRLPVAAPQHIPDSPGYEKVRPYATYAPWTNSPEFLSIYKLIEAYTLVDIYRCWELWTLVSQTAHRDGRILEVGVWRGGTGALIAKSCLLAGGNALVYLCDTFEGVVKAGSNDTRYQGGEHADTSQHVVEDLLGSLGITNARILKGIFPDETANLIETGVRFKLCHIDVDVYQSAKDIVTWVWDRMLPGGVVIFDDYGFRGCEGITKYVNEQLRKDDRLIFHNLNGHAVVVKISTRPSPEL